MRPVADSAAALGITVMIMILRTEFNHAIIVMYIAYVMGTAAGLVIIWIELWGE